MILRQFELELLILYLFGVIGKQFAGNDALPFEKHLGVYLLFDGKLEIRGKKSEYIPCGGEFDAVEYWVATLHGKRFCYLCKSIRKLRSLTFDFHDPNTLKQVLF